MPYIPTPIDTSDIVLPKDLEGLIELLAENTHKVWAKTRMQDGWTFGEQRNDERKQHPCLVPFGSIPESEKEYDRTIVLNNIKLMIKLGYKINKER